MKAFLLCTGCVYLLLLFSYPQAALDAAINGIAIWWDILFPALFPFFVISELLLGIGVVRFIGVLLDPLMRPLFRIPGTGGFVIAMGFASGYPVAARLTSTLRKQKQLTQDESQRIVAFCTTSDPVFLIGAVAVGFFQQAYIGGLLVTAHYGAAMLLGILLRFYKPRGTEMNTKHHTTIQYSHTLQKQQHAHHTRREGNTMQNNLFLRAFQAMHEQRLQNPTPLMTLLQQAVTNGLQLVMIIGGLVVFFSVFIHLFTSSNLLLPLYSGLSMFFSLIHIPSALSPAFVNGLFEVTLGVKSASILSIPLVFKVMAAAFIVSWGGLSVHAQIVSLLFGTDIKYVPFMAVKLLHGCLAAIFIVLLWNPYHTFLLNNTFVTPVFQHLNNMPSSISWASITGLSFLFMMLVFIVISFILGLYNKMFKSSK